MKIKFVGAVGKVTGSCTWCIHPRTEAQFLVDCGLVQGGMHQEAENHMPFPFEPNRLKFVLLTHAHMDHCGRIPQLYAQGFRGKVICTAATARLAELQLKDVHRQAGKRARRSKNTEAAFPVYPDPVLSPCPRREWFYPIDKRRPDFKFGTPLPVDDDLFVSFRRSSHMLGCCSITVLWSPSRDFRKSVCFSGDIGPSGLEMTQQFTMQRNQAPHLQCPYLVVESTYGGKPPRKKGHKNFMSRWGMLRTLASKHRTTVIPCFSMQRAQEVLIDLWRALHDPEGELELPGLTVVLDSRMAKEACAIFREELRGGVDGRYLNEELREFRGGTIEDIDKALLGDRGWISHKTIRTPRTSETSGKGAVFDPSDGKKRVIVTASGMCQAGPVLKYLPLLRERDTAFVVTGFQNTPNGQRLQDLAKKQAAARKRAAEGQAEAKAILENGRDVRLFAGDREDVEKEFRVRADVFDMAPYYSGHADIGVLLEYVLDLRMRASSNKDEDDNGGSDARELPSVTVFLNHGDNPSRAKFRNKILAAGAKNLPYHRKIARVEIPCMTSPFFDLERGEWEERPAELVRRLIKTLARRGDGARPAPRRRGAAKKSGNGV